MSVDASDRARRTIGEVLDLLQGGQALQALERVEHACREQPGHVDLMLHRGLALRVLGRLPEALRALDETLAIDPYFFLALMSKGAVLERLGNPRRAALVYRDALKIAPSTDVPAPLEAALDHARRLVEEDSRALAAYLRDSVDPCVRLTPASRCSVSTSVSTSMPGPSACTRRVRCKCTCRACRRFRSSSGISSRGCRSSNRRRR